MKNLKNGSRPRRTVKNVARTGTGSDRPPWSGVGWAAPLSHARRRDPGRPAVSDTVTEAPGGSSAVARPPRRARRPRRGLVLDHAHGPARGRRSGARDATAGRRRRGAAGRSRSAPRTAAATGSRSAGSALTSAGHAQSDGQRRQDEQDPQEDDLDPEAAEARASLAVERLALVERRLALAGTWSDRRGAGLGSWRAVPDDCLRLGAPASGILRRLGHMRSRAAPHLVADAEPLAGQRQADRECPSRGPATTGAPAKGVRSNASGSSATSVERPSSRAIRSPNAVPSATPLPQ